MATRELLNFGVGGLAQGRRNASSFHAIISQRAASSEPYVITPAPTQRASPWRRDSRDRIPQGDETILDQLDVAVLQSFDPNDIIGPAGSGADRWISSSGDLTYTVRFENLATATAPAQEVFIVQQLDPDLDPESFRLGGISFAEQWIDMPGDRRAFRSMIDLSATRGLLVRVVADLDLVTGTVAWMLKSVDPVTGLLPDDPLRGIVPPNRTPPAGEGSVSYSVRPRAGVVTGSRIDAAASITFDLNAPIAIRQSPIQSMPIRRPVASHRSPRPPPAKWS